IVPVFGVGRHEGVHYYAMQFIAGRGLDKVIAEVRRLRHPAAAPTEEMMIPADLTTRSLAEGLATDRFAVGPGPIPSEGRTRDRSADAPQPLGEGPARSEERRVGKGGGWTAG